MLASTTTRPHSSFPLHVAYGLFMFTIAVFNGANYYIEVRTSLDTTHRLNHPSTKHPISQNLTA